MISKEQVIEAQNAWGAGVVKIGSLRDDRLECESYASAFIDKQYLFEAGPVLFKPTKCKEEQFRPTKAEAASYFIAGEDRVCKEDGGFAINPWTKVRFENSNLILEENRAIAMGNYFFTDLKGEKTKVEYSFVYRSEGESLKIILHHSSLPYSS